MIVDKILTFDNIKKVVMSIVQYIRNLFGREKRKKERDNEIDEAFKSGDFTDINNNLSS